MSTSRFGAKVLMKKKNAAIMLPAIQTLRTPNLFDKADATGPENYTYSVSFWLMWIPQ